MHSGPLSSRILPGDVPRAPTSRASAATMVSARIAWSGSMARHSHVKASTTVSAHIGGRRTGHRRRNPSTTLLWRPWGRSARSGVPPSRGDAVGADAGSDPPRRKVVESACGSPPIPPAAAARAGAASRSAGAPRPVPSPAVAEQPGHRGCTGSDARTAKSHRRAAPAFAHPVVILKPPDDLPPPTSPSCDIPRSQAFPGRPRC